MDARRAEAQVRDAAGFTGPNLKEQTPEERSHSDTASPPNRHRNRFRLAAPSRRWRSDRLFVAGKGI